MLMNKNTLNLTTSL